MGIGQHLKKGIINMNSRLLRRLIGGILLICAIFSMTAVSFGAGQVYTSGSNVRMRSSAGINDGNIIATLPKGAALTELSRSGDWVQVQYNGQTGYIRKDLLTSGTAAADTANTSTQPAAVSQAPAATGGHIVCIDPGHQLKGDSKKEPNGPGSSTMKARVTGGTRGTTTGVSEYQLTLAISQQLKAELMRRGYTVYMTRETHEVNISNKERAEYANGLGAEISVRIHANGSSNSGISGALALVPSAKNPYIASLAPSSQKLGSSILTAYCAATGLKNQGVQGNDTMTGINWCKMPVMILEMGYMTNPSDDRLMEDASFQAKMVSGIANGIDNYFK